MAARALHLPWRHPKRRGDAMTSAIQSVAANEDLLSIEQYAPLQWIEIEAFGPRKKDFAQSVPIAIRRQYLQKQVGGKVRRINSIGPQTRRGCRNKHVSIKDKASDSARNSRVQLLVLRVRMKSEQVERMTLQIPNLKAQINRNSK